MNGQISAALVVMGAMFLFAGSAADRTGTQTSSQTELNAVVAQENGSKLVRRRKTRTIRGATMVGVTMPGVMRAEDQITIDPAQTTADQTFLRRANA